MLFCLQLKLLMFELLPPIGDDFESAAILLDLVLVAQACYSFIAVGNDRNPDDQSNTGDTTERLPCLPFHASIRLQEIRRLAQELPNRKFRSAKGPHQPGENRYSGVGHWLAKHPVCRSNRRCR